MYCCVEFNAISCTRAFVFHAAPSCIQRGINAIIVPQMVSCSIATFEPHNARITSFLKIRFIIIYFFIFKNIHIYGTRRSQTFFFFSERITFCPRRTLLAIKRYIVGLREKKMYRGEPGGGVRKRILVIVNRKRKYLLRDSPKTRYQFRVWNISFEKCPIRT